MNKFLEICFKIGKVIIFTLIILCFLSVIGSAIIIPKTFKKVEITSPTFSNLLLKTEEYSLKDNSNVTAPYMTEFQEFSKMFTETGKRAFWYQVQGIDDNYKLQYIRGARVLIADFGAYCKENKCNDYKAESLYRDIMQEYDSEFRKNIVIKEAAEAKQKLDRITAFASIISSILLFILLITVALLIKIEENTRK